MAGVETAAVRVDKFSQDGMVAHIAAHSRLDRALSGLNYARLFRSHYYFFFLKARRAVMGPAKRGPIWAG